ncbi:uncharacterized protein LOC129796634 [Lutzomyia longipalpis]|uniref:uncharacterized protein LOC129796634 n=1 Tax=Lutzomyia longipalpis TaxID=7200 RepID=UPI0024844F55|nr:uncharacterized protein LOC129796634 [Lutzomyia longipalpis]
MSSVPSPNITSVVPQESQLVKKLCSPEVEEALLSTCPKCGESNEISKVRYMFVNEEEAVLKCESSDCLYPFREFIFKNFSDGTVYRYQIEYSKQLFDSEIVPYEGLIEDLSLQLDGKADVLSPEEPYPLDFDLDAVLEHDTASDLSEQFNDIKNWLENIVDEKKEKIKENIEEILAERFHTPTPRKLKKCLEFVKNEYTKQEVKQTDKLKVSQITPKKTSQSLSPLDILRAIKSSGIISLENLNVGKEPTNYIKTDDQYCVRSREE